MLMSDVEELEGKITYGLSSQSVLQADQVSAFYGDNQVLKDVSLSLRGKSVYSLIGPSGCGKSTLLRCFNRMNDFVEGFRLEGNISFSGHNIYAPDIDPETVRKNIGMVFQKPNPFPNSIYKNIIWGPKINGMKKDWDELVETTLKQVGLWDEVSDRLHKSGLELSGGQQQRLCIARTIAMDPKVILMDEPCASLDPISTSKIEELISKLKEDYTILIVTHSMQQARRTSDFSAFMYQGEIVEHGITKDIFESPREALTEQYVSGRFG